MFWTILNLTFILGLDLLWPWPLTQMTTNTFETGSVILILKNPFIWYRTRHILDHFQIWPKFGAMTYFDLIFDLQMHRSSWLQPLFSFYGQYLPTGQVSCFQVFRIWTSFTIPKASTTLNSSWITLGIHSIFEYDLDLFHNF